MIVKVHVRAEPEHAPVQFTKRKPVSGVAVKVTDVPEATVALQFLPQSIPTDAALIAPLPEVFAKTLIGMAKFAVTLTALLAVTVQVKLLPLHAPPQPANILPDEGEAVSVTIVPWS